MFRDRYTIFKKELEVATEISSKNKPVKIAKVHCKKENYLNYFFLPQG